jgi:predicted hotdog family 3-hydroxylacyl-ACP dehydratase
MPLNRAWIEQHIPHRGSMCLLDEVLDWDAASIRCRSATHRAANHPLSRQGQLGIACGIEYAAQAMAVHGALAGALDSSTSAASAPPQVGLLASLRDVRMYAERLDTIEADLICEATQVAGDAASAIYTFQISAAHASLLSGRATVVFDAGKRSHA